MFALFDYLAFYTDFGPKLQYVFSASVIVKMFKFISECSLTFSAMTEFILVDSIELQDTKAQKNGCHSLSETFKMISIEICIELSPKVRESCCFCRLLDARHDFMIFHT